MQKYEVAYRLRIGAQIQARVSDSGICTLCPQGVKPAQGQSVGTSLNKNLSWSFSLKTSTANIQQVPPGTLYIFKVTNLTRGEGESQRDIMWQFLKGLYLFLPRGVFNFRVRKRFWFTYPESFEVILTQSLASRNGNLVYSVPFSIYLQFPILRVFRALESQFSWLFP